jgi:hypothetical protein
VFIPFLVLLAMGFISNQSQIKKIKFVLNNTNPSDLVYDGDIQFNLFRLDLHYFWYGLKKNKEFDTYNKINLRFNDYNICQLVKSKHPKIISKLNIDLQKCGLRGLYRQTKYKTIYIRSGGN